MWTVGVHMAEGRDWWKAGTRNYQNICQRPGGWLLLGCRHTPTHWAFFFTWYCLSQSRTALHITVRYVQLPLCSARLWQLSTPSVISKPFLSYKNMVVIYVFLLEEAMYC